ncbi:MAG: hypothetical protein IJ865_05985, partial [Clostridia bacterium]|nr:hypothetical protein [Clostridia bacterium]
RRDIGTRKKADRMWTTRRVRKSYGGNVCRHCINDMTYVHLYPKDCVYAPQRDVCPRCKKENKHIVSGFKLSGKWKLLGK